MTGNTSRGRAARLTDGRHGRKPDARCSFPGRSNRVKSPISAARPTADSVSIRRAPQPGDGLRIRRAGHELGDRSLQLTAAGILASRLRRGSRAVLLARRRRDPGRLASSGASRSTCSRGPRRGLPRRRSSLESRCPARIRSPRRSWRARTRSRSALLLDRRYPHCVQRVDHQQSQSPLGVSLVGLDPILRRALDLSRARHHAPVPRRLQRPGEPYPVVPASYATRVGPGSLAKSFTTFLVSPGSLHVGISPDLAPSSWQARSVRARPHQLRSCATVGPVCGCGPVARVASARPEHSATIALGADQRDQPGRTSASAWSNGQLSRAETAPRTSPPERGQTRPSQR